MKLITTRGVETQQVTTKPTQTQKRKDVQHSQRYTYTYVRCWGEETLSFGIANTRSFECCTRRRPAYRANNFGQSAGDGVARYKYAGLTFSAKGLVTLG